MAFQIQFRSVAIKCTGPRFLFDSKAHFRVNFLSISLTLFCTLRLITIIAKCVLTTTTWTMFYKLIKQTEKITKVPGIKALGNQLFRKCDLVEMSTVINQWCVLALCYCKLVCTYSKYYWCRTKQVFCFPSNTTWSNFVEFEGFSVVIKFWSVVLCQYAYVMMKYFGKEVLSGCKTKS